MRKISGSVQFSKKIFPKIWLGGITLFLLVSISIGASEQSLIFLIAPIAMLIFGTFAFKKLLWDLADEVYDDGESLIFRNNGKEQRIYLTDIININHSLSSPERIVIQVRTNGEIGQKLAFSPPMRIFPFSKNSIVSELISRVDRARNT